MMKQFFIYPWNWVILIVGLALLVAALLYLVRRSESRGEKKDFRTNAPLDLLKERYARGELSPAEYERKKKDLLSEEKKS